jgi:hypothetical protein
MFTKTGDKLVDEYAPSLVLVEFNMPYSISGVTERNYHGTGVVLDPVRGLVAVDRNTVPVSLGDVRLTFAGTVQVDGTVEYIHPLHNLAVIHYDPRQLGDTPVKAVKFAERMPATGETIHVVGLQPDNRVASQPAVVSSIGPVGFPLSRTLQFRDANLEIVRLVNGPSDFDGRDRRQARRRRGALVELRLRAGPRTRAAEPGRAGGARAGDAGVRARRTHALLGGGRVRAPFARRGEPARPRQSWIDRVTAHNPKRRTVLTIDRTVAGSPAAALLEPGDLLLAIDGKVVNSFADASAAVGAPEVTLTIWRAGKEMTCR